MTRLIIEFIKLAPRYLFALGVASGFLLFLPEPILNYLDIYDFTHVHRSWIGVVFIFSLATIITAGAAELMNIIKRWILNMIHKKNIRKRLHNLTEAEKQILRFYIEKQNKTNYLRIDDGIVQGLASVGIIFQATSMGNILSGFAHNISDHAWYYLSNHRELLQGNTNTCRTDKCESGSLY